VKHKHALIALALVAGVVGIPLAVNAATTSVPCTLSNSTTLTCTLPKAPATTVTTTATATVTVTAKPSATPTPSPTPTSSPTTPTPTPTPTSTPTALPSSGFPDATNTGVPAGTVLHTCARNLTAPGTYDACEFTSGVGIYSTGITITRSLIHGQVGGNSDDLLGAHLVDTEIDCGCQSQGANDTPTAIMYDNFTLTRVNIHNSGHGVAMGSNVTIEDSWIHGLGGNTDAHKDGIYVGDGHDSVIRHNTITCNDGSKGGCTAAIGLLTDFGPITRFTIDHNLLNTIGSYCFYGAGGPQKRYGSDHITFTDNVFGRDIYPQCAYYGPVTYWDSTAAGMVWANNHYADGTPVAAEY
jgi:hypothetical protein